MFIYNDDNVGAGKESPNKGCIRHIEGEGVQLLARVQVIPIISDKCVINWSEGGFFLKSNQVYQLG